MGGMLKSLFLREVEPPYLEFWKSMEAVYYFLKGRTKSSGEFSLVCKRKSVHKLLLTLLE